MNKARLRVLQAQDEQVEEIVEEAKRRLSSVPSSSEYPEMVEKLIIQSIYRFMDGSDSDNKMNITIQVRKQDESIAQKALKNAAESFERATKLKLSSFNVDSQNWLPDSVLGGIVASANGGRIVLSNTLESRLDLAVEALLPVMRTQLFGPSESRHFFN